MSLKIGSGAINALYVGTQKISKAYVGEDLVFSAVKPSRLPAGYTELEYVQIGPNVTTAFQYLAGYLNNKSVLYIDFEVIRFPSSSSQYANLLYAYANENNTIKPRFILVPSISTAASPSQKLLGIKFGSLNSGGVAYDNWISITNNVNVPQRCKLLVDYPNLVVKDSDVIKANLTSANIYTGMLYIGDDNANATAITYAWGTKGAAARIRELKITTSSSTSASYNHHWIPAKNSSGHIGFYDILNAKWLRINVATAGPAV